MQDSSTLHYIKILPHKIIVYPETKRFAKIQEEDYSQLLKAKQKAYCGEISKRTKSIIEQKLSSWKIAMDVYNELNDLALIKAKRRFVFFTLTLSSSTKKNDKWIKRNLLDQFIINMKSKYGMSHYFWKAEVQKNGNLHFHFLTDIYIDKVDLRRQWNYLQWYHGIIKKSEVWYDLKKYPSTEIHSLKDVRKSIKYILKYVTKNENVRKIEGAVWGMDDKTRNLIIPPLVISSELDSFKDNYMLGNIASEFHDAFYSVYSLKKDLNLAKSKTFHNADFYYYYECLSFSYWNDEISADDLFVLACKYVNYSYYSENSFSHSFLSLFKSFYLVERYG